MLVFKLQYILMELYSKAPSSKKKPLSAHVPAFELQLVTGNDRHLENLCARVLRYDQMPLKYAAEVKKLGELVPDRSRHKSWAATQISKNHQKLFDNNKFADLQKELSWHDGIIKSIRASLSLLKKIEFYNVRKATSIIPVSAERSILRFDSEKYTPEVTSSSFYILGGN